MRPNGYLVMLAKFRRRSAGLPRRNMSVRSAHHVLKVAVAESDDNSDASDCEEVVQPILSWLNSI